MIAAPPLQGYAVNGRVAEQDPADRSGLALKLLAALNVGLVEALRSADRQLMRLEAERDGTGASEEWSAARQSSEILAIY